MTDHQFNFWAMANKIIIYIKQAADTAHTVQKSLSYDNR